jgi:hypothetical protein
MGMLHKGVPKKTVHHSFVMDETEDENLSRLAAVYHVNNSTMIRILIHERYQNLVSGILEVSDTLGLEVENVT